MYLFDNYASVFPSFEFFCQVMDQCTQNYECLVIDNTTQSSKLEDSVYWYKANMHGDFRIGAPEFWQHSMNKKREEEDAYDPNASRKLKGPMINIKKV